MRQFRIRGLILILLLLWPAQPVLADSGPLATILDRVLDSSGLAGSSSGALVISLPSNEVVYERNPDLFLIPASNLKVLTAIASLSAFGSSHQFLTAISAGESISETGHVDTLCVAGGGDPTLTSEQWWRIAADLRALGLRRVLGDIIVDSSHFDDVGLHPTWGVTSSRAYHAPVEALSANYGAFEVHVSPGKQPGDPVRVRIDPPSSYFVIDNRAQTGPLLSRQSLRINRQTAQGRERVQLSGKMPIDAGSRRFARSVGNPVNYAGALFAMQLEALKINVDGRVRRGSTDRCPETLHEFKGYPLSLVVNRLLKWSNNYIGESLIKSLAVKGFGIPGNWDAGIRVARREVESIGVKLDGMRWVDGSGLSRHNRINARILVNALVRAREDFLLGPEFIAALPIGRGEGTLQDRGAEIGSFLRAKTGMLKGVVGLTGYVPSAEDEWLVFSVLVNGFRNGPARAVDALDDFALELRRASLPRAGQVSVE